MYVCHKCIENNPIYFRLHTKYIVRIVVHNLSGLVIKVNQLKKYK